MPISVEQDWVDPQKQEPTEEAVELLGRLALATNVNGGESCAILED